MSELDDAIMYIDGKFVEMTSRLLLLMERMAMLEAKVAKLEAKDDLLKVEQQKCNEVFNALNLTNGEVMRLFDVIDKRIQHVERMVG